MRKHLASLADKDSPHPRGWTRWSDEAYSALDGFPAPAGMDPRRA